MTSNLMSTPSISGAEAELVARKPDALREDDPPFLRFEEGTKEDRNESIRQGRMVYLPVTYVYMRARGDTKSEVPDIVEGWKIEEKLVEREVTRKVYRHEKQEDGSFKEVEKEIVETVQEPYQYRIPSTPWIDKLNEKLHHGFITQRYYDHCIQAFDRWKNNREAPISGTPVKGWNQISLAMQNNMIELGIRSIEEVAEMTEEAMDAVGMGSREAKKRAIAYMKTSDHNVASAELSALQAENDRLRRRDEERESAFEAKLAELESRINETPPKRKPGRPKKEKADGPPGDASTGN